MIAINKALRSLFWKLPFANSFYNTMICCLPQSLLLVLIQRKQVKFLASLTPKSTNCFLLVMDLSSNKSRLELTKKITLTVQSLVKQSYTNWQLLVLEEGNVSMPVEALSPIKEKVVYDKSDIEAFDLVGHISPGDLLHPLALNTFASQSQNESQVIYSDSFVLQSSGKKIAPQFKQSWNKALALSHNYLGDFVLYRPTYFKGLDHWLSFSTHYQRVLHVLSQTGDSSPFEHLPYLLYTQQQKDSYSANNREADKASLEHYLSRDNLNSKVEQGKVENSFKIDWSLPTVAPLVSIIIPTRNGRELVQQCIDSIYERVRYSNFEVLLINNGSDEQESIDYFQCLDSQGKVRLFDYPKEFNYSAINNYAAKFAKGEFLVLMNNDIELINDDWLTEMVKQLSRPSIGCVGAKLYYPDDTIQHAGVIVGLGRCAGHSHKHYHRCDNGYMNRLQLEQNYQAVSAALLGIRKDVYLEVGGLNEKDLKIAFNDVDLCLKVQQAGYSNFWSPYIEAYHHESVSRGEDDSSEKRARYLSEVAYMQNTWGLDTITDRYYNPWLTIAKEDFSLDHTSLRG